LRDQLERLQATADELTEELRRGGDDLEAARRANREQMADLNRSRPLP